MFWLVTTVANVIQAPMNASDVNSNILVQIWTNVKDLVLALWDGTTLNMLIANISTLTVNTVVVALKVAKILLPLKKLRLLVISILIAKLLPIALLQLVVLMQLTLLVMAVVINLELLLVVLTTYLTQKILGLREAVPRITMLMLHTMMLAISELNKVLTFLVAPKIVRILHY